ncbi:MAG: zinc ABC transporter substrate-binding protein, partial [SAR324 cluster bacterium]|nr:zinc ABC transporter substrate-binding protein [SAR324 cluster bacterium]
MQAKTSFSGPIFVIFFLLILSSCGQESELNKADKTIADVFVTAPPHAYLVKQIGGDKVNVHKLLTPGDDPHTFEATPKQMLLLKKSRMFFTSEMRLEEILIDRFLSNGSNRNENSPELVPLNPHEEILNKDHNHHVSHAEAHDCAANDPHNWLNPDMLSIQARSIASGLESIIPADSAFIENNLHIFLDSLQSCKNSIEELLESHSGKSFIVFHPSFGHFAEAFNMTQIAIEHEGKSPSPRQLKEIIEMARKEKIKIIFIQPQFDQKAASTVSEAIGAE